MSHDARGQDGWEKKVFRSAEFILWEMALVPVTGMVDNEMGF